MRRSYPTKRPVTRGRAGCRACSGSYRWDWTRLRDRLPALAVAWIPDSPPDLIGPGIAIDETAQLKKGDATACVAPAARRVHRHRGELRECAMRRTVVSPAQRAEMRGDISGSDG